MWACENTYFIVIGILGLLNHLVMSGPVGNTLVAAIHAGAVATFLDRTPFDV